jgi:hypothetical protein
MLFDVDLFVRFRRNVVAANDSRTGQRWPSDLTKAFQREFGTRAWTITGEIPRVCVDDGAPRGKRAIKIVIGGYDIAEVDNLLTLAERAVAHGGEMQRAFARQELREAELNRRMFGYARDSVHCLVAELGRQLGTG